MPPNANATSHLPTALLRTMNLLSLLTTSAFFSSSRSSTVCGGSTDSSRSSAPTWLASDPPPPAAATPPSAAASCRTPGLCKCDGVPGEADARPLEGAWARSLRTSAALAPCCWLLCNHCLLAAAVSSRRCFAALMCPGPELPTSLELQASVLGAAPEPEFERIALDVLERLSLVLPVAEWGRARDESAAVTAASRWWCGCWLAAWLLEDVT
jgi:hypothetical protein